MSDTSTGGPAFPVTIENGLSAGGDRGMTLRDYFAAKALRTFSDDTEELMMENAIKAYKQADAMLKARDA
jgi:hypothetical protein